MKKKLLCNVLVTVLLLISARSYADLTPEESEKRDKIRYAVENGIISLYDLPFEFLVNLEMWQEIMYILDVNNKNITRYELPGMYYSRPYIVNDEIWVFENTSAGKGKIYAFAPDSLAFLRQAGNEQYLTYDGGIRMVFDHTVISGGSDKDVDAVVLWNTTTDQVNVVKLQDGHYVSSLMIEGGRLYAGSCGGIINVWDYENLKFLGNYYSSEKANEDWEIFNQKECITQMNALEDKVIGVGEKTVFIWNSDFINPVKTYDKVMSGSFVFFYEDYLIEYKNGRFVVRHAADGSTIKTVNVEKSIEYLMVTPEKILGDYDDPLLILTLRYNKGLLFYDFNTLVQLDALNLNGETFTVHDNALFATDDKYVYRYAVINRNPGKYEIFLKRIDPDKIFLTEKNYYLLIQYLQKYPEIVKLTGIAEKFLEGYQLDMRYFFKYGKIGEHFTPYDKDVSSDDDAIKKGYTEDIYGYKAIYDITNESPSYYLITMTAKWSGEYGKSSIYEDARVSFDTHAFFIEPSGGKFQTQIEVGEKEPAKFVIYPEKIEKITSEYYKGLMTALDKTNEDTELIDKYLKDERVRFWHDRLKERKQEITHNRFWLFRVFQ